MPLQQTDLVRTQLCGRALACVVVRSVQYGARASLRNVGCASCVRLGGAGIQVFCNFAASWRLLVRLLVRVPPLPWPIAVLVWSGSHPGSPGLALSHFSHWVLISRLPHYPAICTPARSPIVALPVPFQPNNLSFVPVSPSFYPTTPSCILKSRHSSSRDQLLSTDRLLCSRLMQSFPCCNSQRL